ncbi:YqaE/Pmp3 family membrane protein [Alkalihalobacillus sp. FSL W8-0930]
MLYLLAIILPPVAVLFVGRPFQAIINLILTLIFWVPGVIHACLLVADKKADQRAKKYGSHR